VSDAADAALLSFEAAIERLQTIVEELEGGVSRSRIRSPATRRA